MKKINQINLVVIFSLFIGFSNLALADGFVCQGVNTGLNLKVYNHTQASAGTRSPAVLVVSDPSAEANNQTIATFTSDAQTLSYQGYGAYLATVDSNDEDVAQNDKNIAGAKFNDLQTIEMNVNFSYSSVTTGLAKITTEIPGKVTYRKKSGETIEENLTCTRYLKN